MTKVITLSLTDDEIYLLFWLSNLRDRVIDETGEGEQSKEMEHLGKKIRKAINVNGS